MAEFNFRLQFLSCLSGSDDHIDWSAPVTIFLSCLSGSDVEQLLDKILIVKEIGRKGARSPKHDAER